MEISRNNLTQVNVLANQKRENVPFANLGSNKLLSTDVFVNQHSNAKNVSFGGFNKSFILRNEFSKAISNDVKSTTDKVVTQAGDGLKEFKSGLEKELKEGLQEDKKKVLELACKFIPGFAAAFELVKASESGESNET